MLAEVTGGDRVKDIRISEPFILALSLNDYDPFFGAESREDSRDLDQQVYLQVIDHMKTSRVPSVLVLSGGEPFFDSRLREALSIAKERGWSTSVDTWAGFEKQATSLKHIDQMRLRLLSLDPKKHDELLGQEGTHQRALALGESLAAEFPGEKILVFPICQKNCGEMSGILDWCRSHAFHPNMFIVPRRHAQAFGLDAYPQVIKEICALPLHEIIIDTPLLGLHGWPNLCSGGRLAMFIDVDGGVKPCPYFSHPLCHLDGEGVSEAWRRLQEEVASLNNSCSYCPQFHFCGGGCLANKTESGKEYYCPYNSVTK